MKKAFGLFSVKGLKDRYFSPLLLTALLLISLATTAQHFTPVHNYQAPDGIASIKYLGIPYGGTPLLNTSRTLPGAIFFNTADSSLYTWTGTQWLVSGGKSLWSINGNSGITGSNFIGLTNNGALKFRTNNIERLKIDSLGQLSLNGLSNTIDYVPFSISSIEYPNLKIFRFSEELAGQRAVLSFKPNNNGFLGLGSEWVSSYQDTIRNGGNGGLNIRYNDVVKIDHPTGSGAQTAFQVSSTNGDNYLTLQTDRRYKNAIIGDTTGGYPSAKLAVNATDQGFLPPRMTTAQKNAISSPVAGLMLFDNNTTSPWYWNGSAWVEFGSGTGGGGGTPGVTSVTSGLFMNFSTITGTGPVSADTSGSGFSGYYIRINDFLNYLPSTLAYKNAANTFNTGSKQSFTHSSTTAGIRIVPAAGDPSSLSSGDAWYNSTTNWLKYYSNGAPRFFVNTDEAQILTGKDLSTGNTFPLWSNSSLANMAASTFKGRKSGTTGVPQDLTATEATAELNNFTTSLKGLVPVPTASSGKFLAPSGWVNDSTGVGQVLNTYTAAHDTRIDTAQEVGPKLFSVRTSGLTTIIKVASLHVTGGTLSKQGDSVLNLNITGGGGSGTTTNPLTIGTGLTGTAGTFNGSAAVTITNDAITGKAGGQTIAGGINAGDNLTFLSTLHTTKGNIFIGNLGTVYNGVNNALTGMSFVGASLAAIGSASAGGAFTYRWINGGTSFQSYLQVGNSITTAGNPAINLDASRQAIVFSAGNGTTRIGGSGIAAIFDSTAAGHESQSTALIAQLSGAAYRNVFTARFDGYIQGNLYGSGTKTGTPVYGVAWDANGRLLETSLGGGGSIATLSDVSLTSLATNDFLKYNGTNWINRTPANVKVDLSLNNVDNTSDATKLSAVRTATNLRITKRVGSTTSSATPTINTDNVDIYELTAQAVDITSFTTNLSGTPTDGQTLLISITGTASRAITWGASFEASSVTLPTTTSGTNRQDDLFIWNPVTSKWRIIGTS